MANWVFDHKLILAGFKIVTAKDEHAVEHTTEDFESDEAARAEWQKRFDEAWADPEIHVELSGERMFRVLKKETA